MKKVLIITASPETESNSTTMAENFVKEFGKNAEYKIMSVNDIPLAMYSYQTKTPHPKTETKFIEICETIKNCDGLVIATPTYNFGIPARLKNFVDRIGFMALDYKKINKFGQPTGQLGHLKTFFLVSGGSPKWAYYLLYFFFPSAWLKMVFWYYGAKGSNSLYGENLTFKSPAKNNKKLLKQCQKAGKKWIQKL